MNKLWLSIKSEPYEVECNGSGSTDSMEPRESIEHCKGTGKIGINECRECGGGGIMTVQLQTKPDKLIELATSQALLGGQFGEFIQATVFVVGFENIIQTLCDGWQDQMTSHIVDLYKSGKLHHYIRDCLEEVPVS